MFKNALVSVSDKTGLVDFLRPLVAQGLRVVSSGGTARHLQDHDIPVTLVSEQTGFPEVMGGRVKTLHPNIHMPLLSRSDVASDKETLAEHGLDVFDLVLVNLYPFKKGLEQGLAEKEMVELIDIGGPTLLRAAAKNFERITVLCDPSDYPQVDFASTRDIQRRKALAAKVFTHTSSYDQRIVSYLAPEDSSTSLSGEPFQTLRYGENPQQKGQWFVCEAQGLHQAQILQGKPLSYNNLVDIDGACRTLSLFQEPTTVSVKHNNPCGIASDPSGFLALDASLGADPVSVFGGIVACNFQVDEKCAQRLTELFLECVIAPEFSKEAQQVLSAKKNMRLLQWPQLKAGATGPKTVFKSIAGGYLVQSSDPMTFDSSQWTFHGGERPGPQVMAALEFSWKSVMSLKSNAVAVSRGLQTVGLGMGQVNRVDAVEQALKRATQFHGAAKDWVLSSDAFFPFPDSIALAAKAGVKWIVQPGGSVRDQSVIEEVKKHGLIMAFTHKRHFLH